MAWRQCRIEATNTIKHRIKWYYEPEEKSIKNDTRRKSCTNFGTTSKSPREKLNRSYNFLLTKIKEKENLSKAKAIEKVAEEVGIPFDTLKKQRKVEWTDELEQDLNVFLNDLWKMMDWED